jgi:hypothetical protein
MKSMARNLRFLTLMFLIIVGSGVTTSSAPAPADIPDPACVSTCAGLLYQCLLNHQKNNDQACVSVYHHCLAQCGKH